MYLKVPVNACNKKLLKSVGPSLGPQVWITLCHQMKNLFALVSFCGELQTETWRFSAKLMSEITYNKWFNSFSPLILTVVYLFFYVFVTVV